MGLIAWYPLNGDLKDRGLLGYDLVNSNNSVITINDNGKIGKCYEDLTTSYAYLEAKQPILLNQMHSMFCWVCPEVLTSNSSLDGVLGNHVHTDSNPSNTGINLKRISDTTYKVSLNTANTSNQRTYITYAGKTTLNINEWHHIGFTYNGKKIRLYVDGNLDGEVDFSNMKFSSQKIRIFSWSNAYNSTTYTGKKKINDVRIYDHCLSTTEIKEISKGLVLHYNFEDVIVPYENERYAKGFNIYNNKVGEEKATASITQLKETFEGSPIWRLTMSTDSESVLNRMKGSLWGQGVYTDTIITFNPSIPVTFGILYRNITHNDAQVGGNAKNRYDSGVIPSIHYKNNWYRVGQYRINKSDTAGTDCFYVSFMCPSLQLNEEIIIDFCCPEQYRGINFLPERKNYSKEMDLTIYDSSGYGHDGTIESGDNAVIFQKSSPEGEYCAQFKGNGQCYIKTDRLFYDNINQCHTVCAWVKLQDDTIGNQQLINWNLGYRLLHDATNKRGLLYVNSGVNDCYVYHQKLTLNQWEHIAYIFDRNNNIMNVYINGTLVNSTKTGSPNNLTPNGFGAKTYFGTKFKGELDDIRVYATALNSNDIKQLYSIKSKIDKDGNIFTGEFIESQTTEGNLLSSGWDFPTAHTNNSGVFTAEMVDCSDSPTGKATKYTCTTVGNGFYIYGLDVFSKTASRCIDGKKYIVSMYIKSDNKTKIRFNVECSTNMDKQIFDIGKEYTRITFVFTYSDTTQYNAFTCYQNPAQSITWSINDNIYIHSFCVEEYNPEHHFNKKSIVETNNFLEIHNEKETKVYKQDIQTNQIIEI